MANLPERQKATPAKPKKDTRRKFTNEQDECCLQWITSNSDRLDNIWPGQSRPGAGQKEVTAETLDALTDVLKIKFPDAFGQMEQDKLRKKLIDRLKHLRYKKSADAASLSNEQWNDSKLSKENPTLRTLAQHIKDREVTRLAEQEARKMYRLNGRKKNRDFAVPHKEETTTSSSTGPAVKKQKGRKRDPNGSAENETSSEQKRSESLVVRFDIRQNFDNTLAISHSMVNNNERETLGLDNSLGTSRSITYQMEHGTSTSSEISTPNMLPNYYHSTHAIGPTDQFYPLMLTSTETQQLTVCTNTGVTQAVSNQAAYAAGSTEFIGWGNPPLPEYVWSIPSSPSLLGGQSLDAQDISYDITYEQDTHPSSPLRILSQQDQNTSSKSDSPIIRFDFHLVDFIKKCNAIIKEHYKNPDDPDEAYWLIKLGCMSMVNYSLEMCKEDSATLYSKDQAANVFPNETTFDVVCDLTAEAGNVILDPIDLVYLNTLLFLDYVEIVAVRKEDLVRSIRRKEEDLTRRITTVKKDSDSSFNDAVYVRQISRLQVRISRFLWSIYERSTKGQPIVVSRLKLQVRDNYYI